jgi:hypothetical protein
MKNLNIHPVFIPKDEVNSLSVRAKCLKKFSLSPILKS